MRAVWSLGGTAGLLCLVTIGAYIAQFADRPFSTDPHDWAQFGDYLSGTLGPPLSFLALLGLIFTIRIQHLAHTHSEVVFREQQEYLLRKERKEEWLSVIHDAEQRIRDYLDMSILLRDGRSVKLAMLINTLKLRLLGTLKQAPRN